MIKSLLICKTQLDVSNLVSQQPDSSFFFKSMLEFEGNNLVSLLSFDSTSMKRLLSEENNELFTDRYPLFYKNKLAKGNGKFYYRNAIENCIKLNQVSACNYIIDYIIKWQNNYTSSEIFKKVLPRLLTIGINLAPLMDSNIFKFRIDFDTWPSNHTNDEATCRAYSHNLFYLRNHYEDVYPEEEFEPITEHTRANKVYKIRYTVNLLP